MNDQSAEVNELLVLSEEDLFKQIGESLSGLGAFPPSKLRTIEKGKKWFQSKRGELVDATCGNSHVKKLAAQDLPTHEVVVAICGALDLASHILGQVPAITVAVLIARLGIHSLCKERWQERARADQE